MNIVFIVSSLEAGHDGVGDYTRLLASELILNGNSISILALNDQYLSNSPVNEIQIHNNQKVNVLRLSSRTKWEDRVSRAKSFIDYINPDWLSLQYVPFGFHDKGLHFGLASLLSFIGVNRKWHIMFHELWVGMDMKSSLKFRLWGIIQRQLIIDLVTRLKPSVIHTQSRLYKQYLERNYFNVKLLPLISNIPVISRRKKTLDSANLNLFEYNKIIFASFGSIHPDNLIVPFVNELAHLLENSNTEISLTIVGKHSIEQDKWVNIWEEKGFNVDVLGEQSESKISEALSKSTFGLSTTAYSIIDKSGSVAAMLAHKLPVICIASKWRARGIIDKIKHSGVTEYEMGTLKVCIKMAGQGNPAISSVSDIAQIFANSLVI